MKYDVVVVGGGAAGMFAAITAKERFPERSVCLLEKTAVLLSKVRISGGGRCNVTHSCFEPRPLTSHYPRGEKELLGPFHRFQPRDTQAWFTSRGVSLKTEADGRMFPTTDSSETIIHCLLEEARRLGVVIILKQHIESITKTDHQFILTRTEKDPILTSNLILATGSHPSGHRFAEHFGHTIVAPVPSLFTFNVPTSPLKELSGVAVSPVRVSLKNTPYSYEGPLLITHFGFSGPAILKLSAWGARVLAECHYKSELIINWLPHLSPAELLERLNTLKKQAHAKCLQTENPFKLPKNLWKHFLGPIGEKRLNAISLKELQLLATTLQKDTYFIDGKTTHKEEFVTCGGVCLKEIDFKSMQSKKCPGLFFAGEILNIDGITGGFNFQNAWSTGFIAGSSLDLLHNLI